MAGCKGNEIYGSSFEYNDMRNEIYSINLLLKL
jgi:hypothetical protein